VVQENPFLKGISIKKSCLGFHGFAFFFCFFCVGGVKSRALPVIFQTRSKSFIEIHL